LRRENARRHRRERPVARAEHAHVELAHEVTRHATSAAAAAAGGGVRVRVRCGQVIGRLLELFHGGLRDVHIDEHSFELSRELIATFRFQFGDHGLFDFVRN
jgi:hypothetical protein